MTPNLFTITAIAALAGTTSGQFVEAAATNDHPQSRGAPLLGTAYIVHGGQNAGATAGGELAILDLATGSITSLGLPTGEGLTGIAYAKRRFFASTDDNQLATIDLDGTLISQAPLSGDFVAGNNDKLNDLAADTHGNLFGVARISGTDQIVTVETDGTVTILAPVVNPGGFAAITVAEGELWVSHTGTTDFTIYDLAGNFSRTASPTGTTGSGVLGLTWDVANFSFLYSSCCDAERDDIYAVSGFSGETQFLFDPNDGRRIQDIEVLPPLPFIAEWENENGATATATFNLDLDVVNDNLNLSPTINAADFPNFGVSDFSMNVAGSASGNGQWTQSDFDSMTLNAVVELDASTEWVGQTQNTNNWGEGEDLPGFNGDHDFNVFGITPGAPVGSFFYELSPQNAPPVFVTSFAPGVPTIWITGTQTNAIYAADADGAGTPSIVFGSATPGTAGPAGIDYDQTDRTLYWSGGNNRAIVAGRAITGGSTTLFDSLDGEALDLSFDTINDRVFIAEGNNGVQTAPAQPGATVTQLYTASSFG
ncbi:MAG: hypothetical protein AAFN41_05255, partial [Planctomycetota bacterium]